MRTYCSSCDRVLTSAPTEGVAFACKAPSARAASPTTFESSSRSARLKAGWMDSVCGARSIKASTALRRTSTRWSRRRFTSRGIAGGPIRRMTSKVMSWRSSFRLVSNRASKGSDRGDPSTRAVRAIARTFGSLASSRLSHWRTEAKFRERCELLVVLDRLRVGCANASTGRKKSKVQITRIRMVS